MVLKTAASSEAKSSARMEVRAGYMHARMARAGDTTFEEMDLYQIGVGLVCLFVGL